MILFLAEGRLGNQLFQYAFLEKKEKDYLLKDLDKRFLSFEIEMANLYKNIESL